MTGPVDELTCISAISPDPAQAGEATFQERQDQAGAIPVLDVRRMDDDSQDQPERVDDNVPLAAVDLLARVIAARPPFSVVLTLWLSTIAALGLRGRPS